MSTSDINGSNSLYDLSMNIAIANYEHVFVIFMVIMGERLKKIVLLILFWENLERFLLFFVLLNINCNEFISKFLTKSNLMFL